MMGGTWAGGLVSMCILGVCNSLVVNIHDTTHGCANMVIRNSGLK